MKNGFTTTAITPELLLRAYAFGVFPMAENRDDDTLFWLNPEKRGVLPLETFHIPRSLRKLVRRHPFDIRCNYAFREVVKGCAEPRPQRPQTWISRQILDLYTQLHQQGHAHSVECWISGVLVGGLYGVSLGGAFFGESMFSRESNASKIALVHLVARLKLGGFTLLDTQFVTEHLSQFGTVEIAREDYKARLSKAINQKVVFPEELPDHFLSGFLQSTTQTS